MFGGIDLALKLNWTTGNNYLFDSCKNNSNKNLLCRRHVLCSQRHKDKNFAIVVFDTFQHDKASFMRRFSADKFWNI